MTPIHPENGAFNDWKLVAVELFILNINAVRWSDPAPASSAFNRLFELDRMVERLAYIACRTAPLPYRFATMAEVHT